MGEFSDEPVHRSAPPSPPRWKGVQSLELVHRFNGRCLELLSELAAADAPPAVTLPIVAANRELWVRLDPEARQRAAHMHFVILDAHFRDETWWRQVARAVPQETQSDEHPNGLPREVSEQLMHEATMFAWQTARWDRTAAQVLLGMSRPSQNSSRH